MDSISYAFTNSFNKHLLTAHYVLVHWKGPYTSKCEVDIVLLSQSSLSSKEDM